MSSLSLSPETLAPLVMAAFTLDYRLEGEPLQICAKRFRNPSITVPKKNPQEVTLLMIAGIGCGGELWLPAIKRVFELQSRSSSNTYIKDIWTVDWPNQGDSALVNEHALKITNPTSVTPLDISVAARGLVKSGLIDLKNTKLVGVSHSAGTGGVLAVSEKLENIPWNAIIMVEPPLFSRNALGPHLKYISRSVTYNMTLPDVWPTVEEAVKWHMQMPPYNAWHPEAIQVFKETHFRYLPDPFHTETQGVTPKTHKTQVSASFNAGHELHECVDVLQEWCSKVPVHVIFGGNKTFWPKALANSLKETVARHQTHFASLKTVPNGGHYIAQENPQGFAEALLEAIRGTTWPKARL